MVAYDSETLKPLGQTIPATENYLLVQMERDTNNRILTYLNKDKISILDFNLKRLQDDISVKAKVGSNNENLQSFYMNEKRDTGIFQSGDGLYLLDCKSESAVSVSELDLTVKLDGRN
jgi:hypothetical protein